MATNPADIELDEPASAVCGLPPSLAPLAGLAVDMRWSWSHATDAVWATIDGDLWARTRNPWLVLQSVSPQRLRALADDPAFRDETAKALQAREAYLQGATWWSAHGPAGAPPTIAYFSLEYGIGEPLPI